MVDDGHTLANIANHQLIPQTIHSQDFDQILDSPLDDCHNMDQYFPQPDLSHLSKPPALNEVEHIYNFDVNINGVDSGKSSWVYSSRLKKVFIKMNSPFTAIITYTTSELNIKPSPLFLRIIPVFTEPSDQHEPVNRCKNHQTDPTNPKNHHILSCKNQDAEHLGNASEVNYETRLCVYVPLKPCARDNLENITLEFSCQNSCASGINRKTTALIFALENESKEILGSRLMYFKVCSCPKRDKAQEELKLDEQSNKRRADDQLTPGNGKRPCKIIVKQEVVKQEYSPEAQAISSTYSPEAMQQHQPALQLQHSPQLPPLQGISLQLVMPTRESTIDLLKFAINQISGMLLEANDDFTKQQLQQYRQSMLHLKQEHEQQMQMERQYPNNMNFMQ